jgi:hypothetical protein
MNGRKVKGTARIVANGTIERLICSPLSRPCAVPSLGEQAAAEASKAERVEKMFQQLKDMAKSKVLRGQE